MFWPNAYDPRLNNGECCAFDWAPCFFIRRRSTDHVSFELNCPLFCVVGIFYIFDDLHGRLSSTLCSSNVQLTVHWFSYSPYTLRVVFTGYRTTCHRKQRSNCYHSLKTLYYIHVCIVPCSATATRTHHHHHPRIKDSNTPTTTALTNKPMSNLNFSTTNIAVGSTTIPLTPLRIKHLHRHTTTGADLLIPTNLTYFTPQHHHNNQPRNCSAPGTPTKGGEKRSPVNKSVQQINSEEEASVLSRYPFHGNRALPSTNTNRAQVVSIAKAADAPVLLNQGQRWSLIDVNNNRLEFDGKPSEAQVMLQPVELEGRGSGIAAEMIIDTERRPRRQLSNIRSHSSRNKIHYKSPPLKRYSNVYDYTYMSDPSLNAIYEDSDSQ